MKSFPSANELNELTQASMSTKDGLLEKLETAAERGKYACPVNALICPPDLQTMLAALGYEVQAYGRVIQISWRRKNENPTFCTNPGRTATLAQR